MYYFSLLFLFFDVNKCCCCCCSFRTRISHLMITELFYSHIRSMDRSSLHTRRFRRMQLFAFIYRLTKTSFAGPKRTFPGLSRNGLLCSHTLVSPPGGNGIWKGRGCLSSPLIRFIYSIHIINSKLSITSVPKEDHNKMSLSIVLQESNTELGGWPKFKQVFDHC